MKEKTHEPEHKRARLERAAAVRDTRSLADKCIVGGRIDREALERLQEEDHDVDL